MTDFFPSDKVARSHFVVAGCGALGNEVLKCLALMGVGSVVAVDFDVVEEENLDRSVLFRREDVGRLKVEAARDGIRRLNPSVEVETIAGDVAHDLGIGIIREADAVIGCVDSRWARYCINRLAMRAGKPWIDGGIHGLDGTARVFRPGENCYACSLSNDEISDLRRRMPCSGVIRRQIEAGHAPTTAIVASVIGAIEAQEALKIATGAPGSLCGRMAVYEGSAMTMRTVEFKAYDEDCPCHEVWPVDATTDIGVDMTVCEALGKVDAFCLRDDCFVDYVVSRSSDERSEVMLPGRRVAGYIETDSRLGQYPLSGYYQHEYSWIDGSFPYGELTLRQLGVTPRDVLRARMDNKEKFIELK